MPDDWRITEMIFLHKSGPTTSLDNFRGIALVEAVYKAYATLLNSRLSKALETDNIFPEEQHGFRPERSTVQKCVSVNTIIMEANFHQTPLYGLLLDFSKAFDRVEKYTIREVMAHYGIPESFTNTMIDLLDGGTITVRLQEGRSESAPYSCGVPQGPHVRHKLCTSHRTTHAPAPEGAYGPRP